MGWTLVNTWTVPIEKVRAQAVRLTLSLVAGALVVGLLAATSAQASLAGALVFVVCALVAYSGNAKQASRIEEILPLPRPTRPALSENASTPRQAVLLVCEGEPPTYDGPEPWARRFRQQEVDGEAIPHWFVRPLIYARIRTAYTLMGGENPLNSAIARVAKQVEGQLGSDYLVQDACLAVPPKLTTTLIRLAEEGFSRILLVPLSLNQDTFMDSHELRGQVVLSRVRELGIKIHIAPAFEAKWPAESLDSRLAQLVRGKALTPPERVPSSMAQALHRHVLDAIGE